MIARPARLKGNALGPRRIFKRTANRVIHADTLRERNALRESFRLLGQINHGFFYHKFAEKAKILLLVACNVRAKGIGTRPLKQSKGYANASRAIRAG